MVMSNLINELKPYPWGDQTLPMGRSCYFGSYITLISNIRLSVMTFSQGVLLLGGLLAIDTHKCGKQNILVCFLLHGGYVIC